MFLLNNAQAQLDRDRLQILEELILYFKQRAQEEPEKKCWPTSMETCRRRAEEIKTELIRYCFEKHTEHYPSIF